MSAAASPGLLEIADELYAVGLAEFTPTRDAKVKELKGTPLAAQVKALRKPSTAAWVLNLLVRRETEQVDQVLSVGAALREAQRSMSAGELRALTRQRRQVTAAVTTQARRLAAAEGLKVTSAVSDQVESMLTAAIVDAECGRALRSGLLVSTLSTNGWDPVDEATVAAALAAPEALGFTATAREAPAPGPPDLKVVPDPEKEAKRLRAAEERLARAAEQYDVARAAHQEWVSEVERLDARSLQLQAEIDELRRRLAELEESCDALDEEVAEAEESRDSAAAELRTAAAERDAAQAARDRLAP
ncbi:hypothetical protein JK386_15680 [Nocardioides sp. zg-536]|uniref:Uncharacterized protein n=1 Tax=Nocardioides faecalis TaxID=2803858 RepID=A0A938Y356_9ACTN|nr:hypothetical protein [Nocardioides faecalis]MBM9461342.1 hypothetical protein [Nocardioides faecalis]QVI57612.1 hypothetical protein KG111_10990 [Nocardioides faecalis]